MSTEKVIEIKHAPHMPDPAQVATETEKETAEPQPDIGAQLESLREMIPKIRETITELKGAQVRVKDWTVTFGNVESEFIFDLSLKLAVKPQTPE